MPTYIFLLAKRWCANAIHYFLPTYIFLSVKMKMCPHRHSLLTTQEWRALWETTPDAFIMASKVKNSSRLFITRRELSLPTLFITRRELWTALDARLCASGDYVFSIIISNFFNLWYLFEFRFNLNSIKLSNKINTKLINTLKYQILIYKIRTYFIHKRVLQ